MDIKRNQRCGACGGSHLDELFELPNFPVTGIFVTQPEPGPLRGFDQSLARCAACGHLQLTRLLPAAQLYGGSYAHRSSQSHLAGTATDAFAAYVDRLGHGRVFDHVLEIGCNEMVLLRKMAARARRATGIDPIWRGRAAKAPDGIRVIGKFIEEIDLAAEVDGRPDLIISTHNIEHIHDPLTQYGRLLEIAADDALFVIEIPDSDTMVDNLRFDQVFHQHVHYFTLASFLTMVDKLGCAYVGHWVNPRNWGGSVSIAFRKGKGGAPTARVLSAEQVRSRYDLFRRQKADLMQIVAGLPGPVWGYGGGQMVPSLAYHMDTDLGWLAAIVDDNPARDGLFYPHLAPRIVAGANRPALAEATIFITAMDGVRAIAEKLRAENVGHIVSPAPVY